MKKTIFNVFWGWALLGASVAMSMDCAYDGKNFTVSLGGVSHSRLVSPNYQNAQWGCSEKLAAIYDGDDLTVFLRETGTFHWEHVANNYDDARIEVGDAMVALYDGQAFHIYDGNHRGFYQEKVASKFHFFLLGVVGPIAGLYDGDQWVVYDGSRNGFRSFPARSNYRHCRQESAGNLLMFYDGGDLSYYDSRSGERKSIQVKQTYFSAVSLSGTDGVFYDGEDLVGYCGDGGKFVRQTIGFDPFAVAQYDRASDRFVFRALFKRFVLDPKQCVIEEVR